jgi:hypothetical protein
VKCEVCGKGYKSRSGLRRHVKSKHGGDPPGEVGPNDQASEAAPTEDAVEVTQYAEGMRSKPLREACKALGIKLKDVMAFTVYDDKVVLIEGPTGWKRTWQRN